nr:hypothetical protein [Terriglobales bacterium]
MLKFNTYDMYLLGGELHALSMLKPGDSIVPGSLGNRVIETAKLALMLIDIASTPDSLIRLTNKRAEALAGVLEKVPFSTSRTTLLELEVSAVRERLHALEASLQDELDTLPTYCCDERSVGNFAVAKLIAGASKGYPEQTVEKLTPQCIFEIDECGKCLAFGVATAAAFHMLRSVELTILQYLALAKVTIPEKRQNWGEYLKLLSDNDADKLATDHLHNIKNNYRNPLMHPDETLEMCEALSLF